jgi:hypothetical protein
MYISVYAIVGCISHKALIFCNLFLELYLSNCETSLFLFFTVRVSVSLLMRYRFLCIFLYFSERLIARSIPGVSSFFYLEIQDLHKKYLCTELVNLSPIRILFGHIIACVQKYARIVWHRVVVAEVKTANGRLCPRDAQNVIFSQNLHFYVFYVSLCGRHSLVGMASHYGPYDLGSNPSGDEIFRARPDRPQVPPIVLYNG